MRAPESRSWRILRGPGGEPHLQQPWNYVWGEQGGEGRAGEHVRDPEPWEQQSSFLRTGGARGDSKVSRLVSTSLLGFFPEPSLVLVVNPLLRLRPAQGLWPSSP